MLDEFHEALEPDSGLVYYYYGYGLQLINRGGEAQAVFRRAADLGDGDVKAAAARFLR